MLPNDLDSHPKFLCNNGAPNSGLQTFLWSREFRRTVLPFCNVTADGLQWSQDRPGGPPELSWDWLSTAAESTEHHTFTPTVWLRTTCLHRWCDSGLHVHTNGVTQVRTTRLHQWCDSGLHVYINRAALRCWKFWLWSILDFRLGIINWYP